MKALKLDKTFRPVEVIDAVEALVLCLVGKAKAVENYGKSISSVDRTFKLPAVIVLTRFVKYRLAQCSPSRRNIIWRDQNQCQYCEKHFSDSELTLDHVIPRSRKGKNTWQNLVTACKKCNQRKGSKTTAESGMVPFRGPAPPKLSILMHLDDTQISSLWEDYIRSS